MSRSSVLLPAPLRPISATRSPGLQVEREAAEHRRAVVELDPERRAPRRAAPPAAPRGACGRLGAPGLERGAAQPGARLAHGRGQRAQAREREQPRGGRGEPRSGVRGPGQELARRGVAGHARRPRARAPGRRPAGSARAGARPSPPPCPSPRSGAAAATRARRPPRGRAGRWARRAAAARGGGPSPRRSPRAGARPRRACRCAARAGGPRPSASAVSSTAARDRRPAVSPPCSSGSSSSARTPPITTCDSGSWSTVPHTAASSPGAVLAHAQPGHRELARSASPPWKWGTRPQSARRSVDLPEPETPASTVKVPGSIAKLTSRSAGPAASG